MSRPPRTTPKGDRTIRATVVVAVCMVSLMATYVSYSHGYELARDSGEGKNRAWAFPLTVDGLIFSASMVILRASRHDIKPPKAAWFALCTGVAGTLFANVMHGVPYGPVGVLVSTWPAIALVLSFEMLMRLFRPAQRSVPIQAPGQPPAVPPVVHNRAVPAPKEIDAPVPDAQPAQVHPTPAPVPLLKAVPDPTRDDDRYTRGVQLYLESMRRNEPMSQSALARELGMKNRKLAARIIEEVSQGVHDSVPASQTAN